MVLLSDGALFTVLAAGCNGCTPMLMVKVSTEAMLVVIMLLVGLTVE